MASQGSIRCARCSIVAIQIFPEIIQDLIGSNTSATIVDKKISKTKSFFDGLDSTQRHKIQTLQSDGFKKLDFSLVYKIAKYFKIYIEPPTRQWGTAPLPNETSIGDDVERMRRARNNLFHRVEAEIREDEFNDFFSTFVQVGKRVDEYLSKPRDCGYEKRIREYQKCCFDTDTAEKYLEERKENERLKALVDVQVPHDKIVHVLVGNTAREAINKVGKIKDDDGMTSFNFIIHGIEDSTKQAKMLTALVQERNIRTENIEFVSDTSECIDLYINIRNTILKEENHYASELSIFIQKLFMLEEIKFIDKEECNLVITSAEGQIDDAGQQLQRNRSFDDMAVEHQNTDSAGQIDDAGQQLQRNKNFDDMAVEHQNTDDADSYRWRDKKKFFQLIEFSYDLSLNVVRTFIESNILKDYNNSLENFLNTHKHTIYHLWIFNTKCCIGTCTLQQNRELRKDQLTKLYDLPVNFTTGHYKQGRGKSVLQCCACGINVRNTCSLKDLDIILIHTIIRHCVNLQLDEDTWLNAIRDIRNKLAHVESTTGFDEGRLDKWWQMLEGSVLGLAGKITPSFYYDTIESQVNLLKKSDFDIGYIQKILDKLRAENKQFHDDITRDIRQVSRFHTDELMQQIKEVKDAVLDIRNRSFKVAPQGTPQLQIQNSNATDSCDIQDLSTGDKDEDNLHSNVPPVVQEDKKVTEVGLPITPVTSQESFETKESQRENKQKDESESGYCSQPHTPGMQVSVVFRGNCKKKVRENFSYIKFEIIQHIDLVIDAIMANYNILSEQKFYEIKGIKGMLRKTEGLLKHILRHGEGHCKCFLESLQSEDLQQEFILEDLKHSQDKTTVPAGGDYNISIKDIQEHHDHICEKLEISDVLDPLYEYYVITLDDHDKISYTCLKITPRIDRNKTLIQILLNKREEGWIYRFVHVLDISKHKLLLSQIKESASFENVGFDSTTTYKMSIKVTGPSSLAIERQLNQNAEIDNLCRQFAKLNISNIKHGTVLLLMLHPLSPDEWTQCTNQRKQELLTDFVRKLLETSDVKRLIYQKNDVAIEIDEVQYVFGDPAWREDSFTIPSHQIEDVGKIQISFTVQRNSDNDLSVIVSTPGEKHTFAETEETPEEKQTFAEKKEIPKEKHTFAEKEEHTLEEKEERPKEKHAHERPHGSGLHHGLPSEPFIREKHEHSSVVMAIDFGTTYSGFAFSKRDKKERIICKKWRCYTGTESPKTPTTILLSPDKQFVAFGYEAEEQYQKLCSSNEHAIWHYFSHFKMELHSSEILTRNTMIQDSMGNSFPAFDIFRMSISYLKKKAWKLLLEKGYRVSAEEITWIITVPAIWRDAAKQFMREAAVEASIPPKHLTLALEPEVASVHFRVQNVKKTGKDTISKCSPGERFMIVDIGGGTTDITVMECADNSRMKQISMASGGPVGGQTVNDLVFQFLNSVFGEDIMDMFKITNSYDFQKLNQEIEISKRSLKSGDKLRIALPLPLTEIYERETRQTLETNATQDTRYQMKGSNRMVISKKDTEGFLSNVVSKIKSFIDSTLREADKISIIVVVGGFAECPFLQDTLHKDYSSMKVIIPNEAGLAVLKGAVLYGHEPSCVAMRKCNRTYGTKAYRTFLSDDFLDKKIVQGSPIYCKDAFNKLVEIGEYIHIDETRTTEIQPLRDDMSKMAIELYSSTDPNPRYTTEDTCILLGKIVVDIPLKWRSRKTNVIVFMTFGKTEIIVEGREEHSKEPVTTKMDFLAG